MYCKHCGTQNPDGSKFCAGCGAALIVTEPTPASAAEQGSEMDDFTNAGVQNENVQSGQEQNRDSYFENSQNVDLQNDGSNPDAGNQRKPANKKRIGIIAAAAAAVVVLALVLVVGIGGKQEINLINDLEATYSGANGYATVEFHYTDEWWDETEEILENIDDSVEILELLYSDFVTISIEPQENLSNGDTVTVTVTIDEEAAEDLPAKFVGGTKEFTVEGLKEVETVDLFENIKVTYSGSAPYATLQSVTADGENYGATYTWDDKELAIGDTITITAKYDEDALLEKGYMVQSSTYELTVAEGDVDSYAMSLSEIQDEAMEKMKAQAEDVMDAYVADEWNENNTSYDGMEYLGSYFLTLKDGVTVGWSKTYTKLYLVYKVSAWNKKDGDVTYYVAFKYTNILNLADGTYSIDLDECDMTSTGFRFSGDVLSGYYYRGYQTLDSLYSDYVTSVKDDYTCESTVEE